MIPNFGSVLDLFHIKFGWLTTGSIAFWEKNEYGNGLALSDPFIFHLISFVNLKKQWGTHQYAHKFFFDLLLKLWNGWFVFRNEWEHGVTHLL